MNKDNKSNLILLFLLASVLLCSGWKLPDNSPYVIVNSSHGNNERITFAKNMVEYLYVTDSDVVSSYSGTLYGYVGSDLRISFQPYSTPTYQSANYQTINYTITRVVENHLYDTTAANVSKNYELYIIALLGGLCLISFFKK